MSYLNKFWQLGQQIQQWWEYKWYSKPATNWHVFKKAPQGISGGMCCNAGSCLEHPTVRQNTLWRWLEVDEALRIQVVGLNEARKSCWETSQNVGQSLHTTVLHSGNLVIHIHILISGLHVYQIMTRSDDYFWLFNLVPRFWIRHMYLLCPCSQLHEIHKDLLK